MQAQQSTESAELLRPHHYASGAGGLVTSRLVGISIQILHLHMRLQSQNPEEVLGRAPIAGLGEGSAGRATSRGDQHIKCRLQSACQEGRLAFSPSLAADEGAAHGMEK